MDLNFSWEMPIDNLAIGLIILLSVAVLVLVLSFLVQRQEEPVVPKGGYPSAMHIPEMTHTQVQEAIAHLEGELSE